mgnify:FL=1|jgi:hypothetical protein|tara:strand:+ start:210 stop:410 length:201 start_codon:yes stop_codon:yes gene_type:complete
MSSVEERLVIFAICFIISVPVSYVLLKNCVDINSRISIDFNQESGNGNIQKIESKNENNKTDIIEV